MTSFIQAATSRLVVSPAERAGILALLLVAALLGFGNVIQKILLVEADPWLLMALRASIAILVLLPFTMKEILAIRRKSAKFTTITWLTIASFGLGMTLQNFGAKYTSATNVGFLVNTFVIFMPVLVWLSGHGRPKWQTIVASLTCFFGAALLAGGSVVGFGYGDMLCLTSALAFAVWVLCLAGQGPAGSVTIVLTCAQWLPLAILGFVFTDMPWMKIAMHLRDNFAAYIMLGMFVSAFGFLLAVRVQHQVSTCCAAVIYGMEGVFGSWAAYIVLGESLSALSYCGAALIIASIYVAACEHKGNKQTAGSSSKEK